MVNGNSQALATQEPPRTQIIVGQDFGQRSEIRELTDRLRAGLQGGKGLPQDGLNALATMCVAHGLDPFNGEAYLCVNEKKGEHWVQPGIKGLRKLARKQLPDGVYLDTQFEPIPQSEWAALGIPDDAQIAARCTLRRSDATTTYLANLKTAIDMLDGDTKAAMALIGPAPVWVGIGYVPKVEGSRMPIPQLVNKRAETHALRQAFDLPFRYETDSNDYRAVGFELDGEPVPRLENASRTLYGDPDFEGFDTPSVVNGETVEARGGARKSVRPFDAETFRYQLAVKVETSNVTGPASSDQVQYAASLLSAAFKDSPTARKDRIAVLGWLFDRAITSTKSLTTAEASALIDLLVDETGDLSMDGHTELHNCLQAVMQAMGQADMFEDAEIKGDADQGRLL